MIILKLTNFEGNRMSIEYGIKTKKRPDLKKDMSPGDILHIYTEDKGEIFTVTKVGNREFILKQSNHDVAYAHSRGVINQKIMDFEQRFDTYYIITEGNIEDVLLD